MILDSLGWFSRWRHSKGFGVQSPFAFNLICNVINEVGTYYAYAELQALRQKEVHTSPSHREKFDKLLFRLANFQHPSTIFVPQELSGISQKYISAGCTSASLYTYHQPDDLKRCLDTVAQADFVYISDCSNMPALWAAFLPKLTEHSLVILQGIRHDPSIRSWWKSVIQDRATVLTFDLGQTGLVFFDPAYIKQHYDIHF